MKDAREETDRRVARGVARWSGTSGHAELALLPYTRDLELANRLRTLMETDGRRTGSLRPVTVEGQPAFIYVCLSDQQRPFAQGVAHARAGDLRRVPSLLPGRAVRRETSTARPNPY